MCMLFDILLECPTMYDIDELHPLADTEYRLPKCSDPLHGREEKSIIPCIGPTCTSTFFPIEARIDIGSAWEDECRTIFDIVIEVPRKCRDDYGASSCIFDRSDIVECEVVEEPSCIFTTLSKDTDFWKHKKTKANMPLFYRKCDLLQIKLHKICEEAAYPEYTNEVVTDTYEYQ